MTVNYSLPNIRLQILRVSLVQWSSIVFQFYVNKSTLLSQKYHSWRILIRERQDPKVVDDSFSEFLSSRKWFHPIQIMNLVISSYWRLSYEWNFKREICILNVGSWIQIPEISHVTTVVVSQTKRLSS